MKKQLILALVLGIIFAACTHTSNQPQTSQTDGSNNTTETPPPSPTTQAGNQEVVNYTLDLKNFSFTPSLIEAEPGQTIKVKLVNKDGFHDFVIDELNAKSSRLNEGNETIIEITIPEDLSGQEYEFYCSIGNHRQLSMVGKLIIK